MEVLSITGGARLVGQAEVAGSKNASLLCLAATLLADEPVELLGLPRVDDVATMLELLERLDLDVSSAPGGGLRLECRPSPRTTADYELVRRMRAGVCVLGPLLARRQRAVVALPGGCRIGDRPIDLHLAGLAALGADIRFDRGFVWVQARRLRGARVDLRGPRGPTVTGTANVLCAATRAEGTSVIEGAACEPEVVALGRLLSAMGAQIEGLGTSTLVVRGVEQLGGARQAIPPDRIEAATLLLAAAATRGDVRIAPVLPEELAAVLELLRRAGVAIDEGQDWVRARAIARPRPTDWIAQPHPGLPTDLQAQWTVLACLATGPSRVADRVFPDRFAHLAELVRLGARVRRDGGTALVQAPSSLVGAPVRASDLRAAAALVLAGLAAEGTTTVEHVHHLDRGYAGLDEKLVRLGARIVRHGPPMTPAQGAIGTTRIAAGNSSGVATRAAV